MSVLGNAVSAMQVVWVVMEAQSGAILPRLSLEDLPSRDALLKYQALILWQRRVTWPPLSVSPPRLG